MSLIRLTPELRAERGATMSKRKLQLPAGPVRESDDPFLWLPVLQTEAEGLHSLGRKNLLEVLVSADNDSSHEDTTVKVLPAAEKVLEPRLFLVSSSTFGVATSKELEATKKIYSDFHFLSFQPDVGVVKFTVDPELCLSAYIDILQKMEVNPKDINPVVLNGGGTKVLGGFVKSFLICNTVCGEAHQRMSVFPIKNISTARALSKQLSSIIDMSKAAVQDFFKDSFPENPPKMVVGELHICMGFSPAAHFGFHQDECDWTFLIQLSPGESSIRVAGFKKDAEFDFCGRAFLFPGKAYHRSGCKTRRTMTLTMFMHYDKKLQSSPQSAVKVKNEVKNEVDVAPLNPAMDEPASLSAAAGPSDDTASVARDHVQDDKNMSVKGDEKPADDENEPEEADQKEAVKNEPNPHEEPQPAPSAKAGKSRRKPQS